MATTAQWIEGARLRTLPAAISPVLTGTAIALSEGSARYLLAALAMVVALALQIGVNYANDYSDGIRGTDEVRVGPQRLVGSGAAKPSQVKFAAFACFGLAGVVGLVIVVITAQWWLLAVGAACIAAAWFYTGGEHPYGYAGLGELFVFVFFGLVAVAGTVYIQLGGVTASTWIAATAMGALSCAILTANNLRDLANDLAVGKRTLPTRLGDGRTRVLFVVLLALPSICVVLLGWLSSWWMLSGLFGYVFLITPIRVVRSGAQGMALVQVLKRVGYGQLSMSFCLLAGAFMVS